MHQSIVNEPKWWIFIAAALAVMMVDVDITAANLALVTMANDLNLDLSDAQWIINGYMIAAASLMAFGGRLADVYGGRCVFIFGLSLLILTSLAVGLAIGPWSIITSRILQGACVAFTFPVSIVLVRRVFSPQQQGFVVGLMVAIAGISQALGPTIGGIIIHLFNWRWIFLLNIPLASLAIGLMYFLIPAEQVMPQKQKLDLASILVLITGLFILMFAFNEVTDWGYYSYQFITLLATSLLLLGIFIVIEFTSSKPLLELRLLLNKNFILVNIIRFLFSFIYFTLLFTLGLFLQNVLEYSALHAGYALLGLTLVIGLLSIPSGKLIDSIGSKPPIIIGSFMLAVCTGLLSFAHKEMALIMLLLPFIIGGIAIAMVTPATGTAALFSVSKEKGGAAMGILLTNSFIAGALGVAISGSLLTIHDSFTNGFITTMLLCTGLALLSCGLSCGIMLQAHKK